MSILFEYLDRFDKKHRPLTPIADELRADPAYVETDDECPVDGCNGTIWKKRGMRICGVCSVVGTARSAEPSPWDTFETHRPRYRNNSAMKRQVGGFPNFDWVESDDVDGSVSDLKPETFYDGDDSE